MPLFSDDLDLLSSILDDVCEFRGLPRGAYQAEQIGAQLIELYRQGVKDRERLSALAKTYL